MDLEGVLEDEETICIFLFCDDEALVEEEELAMSASATITLKDCEFILWRWREEEVEGGREEGGGRRRERGRRWREEEGKEVEGGRGEGGRGEVEGGTGVGKEEDREVARYSARGTDGDTVSQHQNWLTCKCELCGLFHSSHTLPPGHMPTTCQQQATPTNHTHHQYDLPVLMHIPLVAVDHTERHGVIGSLGDLLCDLHCLLQGGRDHTHLLGGGVKVTQQEFVHADALNWFDQEMVYPLSVAKLLLNTL